MTPTLPTPRRRDLPPPALWLLSVLIGIVAGLGAAGFRALIALIHNLLFLGKFSASYDANVHTPLGPWGAGIILVPVIGAAGVAFLVGNFAPEAKGHGVPEVMEAIYYGKGVIRPIVALIKSLASAISIGSGGSIGREGPIIQIGASFGSTVGQVLRLRVWQCLVLIAAGAGGGIAATFNTPIGGVLFAVEIMMTEISVRTLVPVAISTATATYVGQLFFGAHPSFVVPSLESTVFRITSPAALLSFAGLGLLLGLVSVLFIRSIYGFEHFFEKHVKGGYYVQHMTGMLIVGLLMYSMMSRFGHYYIQGVGYATVQDILSGKLSLLYLLVLLFALKLLATSLALGSGASGGVFSPALFIGATLGSCYALALQTLFPYLQLSPAAFAIAGMGAVVGGTTGATMTAMVMVFEMTLDFSVVLPIIITVALSHAVRQLLISDTIYTRKLTLRGLKAPDSFHADFSFALSAKDLMETPVPCVSASFPARGFSHSTQSYPSSTVLVTGPSGNVVGVLSADEVNTQPELLAPAATLGDIARTNFRIVPPETPYLDLVSALSNTGDSFLLVSSKPDHLLAGDVLGVITPAKSSILWLPTVFSFPPDHGSLSPSP